MLRVLHIMEHGYGILLIPPFGLPTMYSPHIVTSMEKCDFPYALCASQEYLPASV